MAEKVQAITAARLIDGTGGPPLADAVVIVSGDRIESVGTRASVMIPSGAEVLDLGDRTLLPGLIDAHTHFYISRANDWVLRSIEPSPRKLIRAVTDAARLLQAGFTSIRDMGYGDAIYLKQAIDEGDVPGPRMAAARMIILQTGGSPDPHWLPTDWVEKYDYRCRLADGIDEVRKAAREQIRGGADFLKVMASGGLGDRSDLRETYHYTLGELEALVEEARKVGTFVAAHAIGAKAVKNAVRAGAATIEHGSFLDQEAVDLMAEHDVIFVPTLALSHTLATSNASGAMADSVAKTQASIAARQQSVRLAHAAGVRIAAGTDFGGIPLTRHGPNAIEAELLVNAGLSPADAIVSATRRGAEAMGRASTLGTVETGKYADLVALDANPLEDIRALRQVSFVMKGGDIVRDDQTKKS
jgi:imidazolonepropionase-like amidohydrolase